MALPMGRLSALYLSMHAMQPTKEDALTRQKPILPVSKFLLLATTLYVMPNADTRTAEAH
jgi:hypothetical protein